jgi:CBS domain-containing protein
MFFVLLLLVSVSYTSLTGASVMRGLGLWLLLLLAVAVREVARGIASAWHGLELRSLLLLPTGALPIYATREASERAAKPQLQRQLALVGPIANLFAGLLCVGFVLGMSPELNRWSLLERPWITPNHLLRSLVWMQVLLGAINLLPAFPLDGGRVLRSEFTRVGGGLKRTRQAAGLSQLIAIGLIAAGFLMNNLLLLIAGVFVLTFAHMEDQGVLLESAVAAVQMRDVMLTEFSTLSASATLEDAVAQAVHTLQDVFPVVRGRSLVGAVSRQGIFEALQSNGNGYVQGVMTRSFHTAQPGDSLVHTLQKISAGVGAQLVPVVEGERVVGIITPQNLSQSMVTLNQSRRLIERNAKLEQMHDDE